MDDVNALVSHSVGPFKDIHDEKGRDLFCPFGDHFVYSLSIGLQYSVLVAFPKETGTSPPWVVPLSVRRVPSGQTGNEAGTGQIGDLMDDDTLPFHRDLCVQVEDSAYSVVTFLGPVARHENLVTVARLRDNRVLYRLPSQAETGSQPGHPTWYGERFDLQDSSTWGEPDEVAQTTYTTRRGRTYTVHLQGWHDLLMSGTRDCPMHLLGTHWLRRAAPGRLHVVVSQSDS